MFFFFCRHPAMASTANGSGIDPTTSDMETSSVGLLTSSENANNENREKELNTHSSSILKPESDNESEYDSQDDQKASQSNSQSLNCTQPADSVGQRDYMNYTKFTKAGEPLYTDPLSNVEYKFSKAENKWIPATDEDLENVTETPASSENPYENEYYFWSHTKQQWLLKSDHTYDETKKCWVEKDGAATSSTDNYTVDENGVRTYRDKDGTLFEWDEEKKAWFPKIDDDFMAYYQLNYGEYKPDLSEQSSSGDTSKVTKHLSSSAMEEDDISLMDDEQKKANKKRKKMPEPPKWFEVDEKNNTKVYVANLPLDITDEEFVEIMSKYGMILKDPSTHKFKIKLYRDANGELKGDGLCTYIKVSYIF